MIVESKLKELHPSMPIMYIKAVTQDISVCSHKVSQHLYVIYLVQDKQEIRTMYECPVYKTRQRGW